MNFVPGPMASFCTPSSIDRHTHINAHPHTQHLCCVAYVYPHMNYVLFSFFVFILMVFSKNKLK